jgi:hypothetical protein
VAQYARPSSTVGTPSGWAAHPSGTLHGNLGTTTANDTAMARASTGVTHTFTVGLSAVSSPGSGTVTLRYRLLRSRTDRNLTVQVELLDGTTVVQTFETANPGGTFSTVSHTVTSRGDVTDWSALRLRFTQTVSQANAVYSDVSWAELETPDFAAPSFTGTVAAVEGADTAAVAGTATPPAFSSWTDWVYAATPPSFAGTVAATEAGDVAAVAGTFAAPAFSGTVPVAEAMDVATVVGTATAPSGVPPTDVTVTNTAVGVRVAWNGGSSSYRVEREQWSGSGTPPEVQP